MSQRYHHQRLFHIILPLYVLLGNAFSNKFVASFTSSSTAFPVSQTRPLKNDAKNEFCSFQVNTALQHQLLPRSFTSSLRLSNNDEKEDNEKLPSSMSSIAKSLPTLIEKFKTKSNVNEIASAVKSNIVDGELGSRGETYVAIQFALIFFILIGNVPLIGDLLSFLLGPTLFFVGLVTCLLGVIEMDSSLSPWPVPSKGGTLITDTFVFSEVRHPIYSGLLCLMAGLSVWSGSAMRMALTIGLYTLLDIKSDYEEEELVKKFGNQYENYQKKVRGKFVPEKVLKILDRLKSK